MKTSTNQLGFTVVELVVTITVMAILGVIGFVSMTGYLESSRDSVRLTDMNSIYDQLNLSLGSNATLPLPEDYRTITFGNKVITYQGYAKKATMNTIKFEKGGKDPKDGTYYTYTIDRKKKQAQLTGYFEDYDTSKLSLDTSATSPVYTIKSGAYTGRKVGTIGKLLGTLLESGSLMPVQATSTGSLEISNTNTPYVVYFNSTTTASGGGAPLTTAFTNYSSAGPFTYTFASVSAGNGYTCGVKTNGSVYCWGVNDYNQLGDGTIIEKHQPVAIDPSNKYSGISTSSQTCGIKTDGKLFCWGYLPSGQVSLPSAIDSANTYALAGLSGNNCFVKSDGKLFCWGGNDFGQIGNNTISPIPTSTLTSVDSGSLYSSVSSGLGHNCGIRTNGKLYCWGNGGNGQLGAGSSVTGSLVPIVIDSASIYSSISAGGLSTCGIRTNGKLFCWGNNNHGQLGTGAVVSQSFVPIAVDPTYNYSSVSVSVNYSGNDHVCGVRTTGKLYCWGGNGTGQLGDGTTTDSFAAIPIDASNNYISVSAGFDHTCGIRTDGGLYCWGGNGTGQLGDGTIVQKLLPTLVPTP